MPYRNSDLQTQAMKFHYGLSGGPPLRKERARMGHPLLFLCYPFKTSLPTLFT
jgi:hypothetical protein